MKKIALITSSILIAGTLSAHAAPISVSLNGQTLDFTNPPIIRNDRTFVPVRQIFEAFGMDVEWDQDTKTLHATGNNSEISMTIGSNTFYVNGECVDLDVPPFVSDDRTFVPLRAISEALKCKVEWIWDGLKGYVTIIGGILKPSASPTAAPTLQPTTAPTVNPTTQPTAAPSAVPTTTPTTDPTTQPTAIPTVAPTTAPTAQPTAAPTATPDNTERALEQQVLELVNQERTANGLSKLTWAEDLAVIARAHCSDMIERNFFSHTNPDGQSPFDRLKNNGISYRAAAENIAYGQQTAEAVMNAWMNSEGHRANILSSSVREIGIGAVKNSKGTVYWTQLFVSR